MQSGDFSRGVAICFASIALHAEAQLSASSDPVGDALKYAVPLGAAALVLYRGDTPGLREFGYTYLLSQGTTEVLRRAVNSPRPDGTGKGFPSGHTSAVFAAAAFVHRRYGVADAWPYYALDTVTAYERVHHHHHFTKDVLGGAVIGVGSAFLLTHRLPDGGSIGVSWRGGGPWVTYATSL
jgi:membrane-associated phospholipid phosphatase